MCFYINAYPKVVDGNLGRRTSNIKISKDRIALGNVTGAIFLCINLLLHIIARSASKMPQGMIIKTVLYCDNSFVVQRIIIFLEYLYFDILKTILYQQQMVP